MDLFNSIKDYIGPIVGALAGSGLNFHFDKSGNSSRRSDINIENHTNITGDRNSVSNINVVDNSKKTVNYHSGGKSSDGGEGFAVLIAGAAAVVGAIYGYSVYAPLVFSYIVLVIQAIAVFSISYAFTGGLRGTQGWGAHALYTSLALLLLGVSYWYCLPKLYNGYSPTYAEYALRHGAIGYFKIINEDVRNWIISQIAGLSALVAAITFTLFYSISGNNRQRVVAILIAAALIFASGYGADGNFHG